MTDVDVLIVSYLTGDLTRSAVEALRPGDFDVHVWDNSGDVPHELDDAVSVHRDGRNSLFAYPNNQMFRSTHNPYVLLLNPDVQITPDAVHELRRALEDDDAAWGAMPRLRWPDGSDQNYLRRLPTLRGLLADRVPVLRRVWGEHYDRYYCRDVDLSVSGIVEQPPAACLLLRRSAVGAELFDERYALFFNDADLARRMNQVGHCRYVASVTARHVGGASIARARQSRREWVRRQYDVGLLRYARSNVRGWPLLAPVVALRLLAGFAAARFNRRKRADNG